MSKKILLIGGSKGLGEELLCVLTRHTEDHVIYACRSRSSFADIKNKLEWLELDLTWESQEVAAAVRRAAYILGGLDVLIVSSGLGAFHQVLVGDSVIKEIFQINVFGPLAVYRTAIKYLLKSKGKAIFVTSTASRKPGSGGLSLYAASKGAINSWVISEGRRAARGGVGLCAVSPGYFESPMVSGLMTPVRNAATKAIPYGRFGGTGEIALFIKSLLDQSNWSIAGSIFELSGGA